MLNDSIYPVIEWSPNELKENDEAEIHHSQKMKKAILKSEKRRRKAEISKINQEYKPDKSWKKKMTTTKILMYFILINCTVTELYSMYVMLILQDLSSLYSLIGAVVGESISYAIYCAKSFKETKEEAIIQLERDRFNVENELTNHSTNISEDCNG